jgi:hypothetical protein
MKRYSYHIHLLALFSLLWVAVTPSSIGYAQAMVMDTHVEYEFGGLIKIEAFVQSETPIQKAKLFLQAEGDSTTRIGPVVENPSSSMVFEYTPPEHQPLRAFSTVTYWFELALENQPDFISDKYSFQYIDNRFEWQSREAEPFQVNWQPSQGDSDFGQALLDVAQLGLERVQSILSLKSPAQVRIFAYPNAAEMRDTLGSSRTNWVGAHADPDLRVMMVSLPSGPEQRLEMERQIPHELMHIMLYENLGSSYTKLPVWLNEGLASNAELFPNPDYLVLLKSARERENLLPIASLCNSFPREASGTFLAYAEATSFTRFIHNRFGTSGLEALIEAYADGVDCERGTQVALGSSLSQLENQWRREAFGDNIIMTAGKNLLPWLVVMGLILIVPIGVAMGWRQR